GLLRLLAWLAPEPVPLALLLSNAQVAGELAPEVAASVGPLLGDSVAAGDAVAALRCYSLVTPAGGRPGAGAPLGAARDPRAAIGGGGRAGRAGGPRPC